MMVGDNGIELSYSDTLPKTEGSEDDVREDFLTHCEDFKRSLKVCLEYGAYHNNYVIYFWGGEKFSLVNVRISEIFGVIRKISIKPPSPMTEKTTTTNNPSSTSSAPP